LTPVNAERLGLLSRFEEEAGRKPVPIEKVLEAFMAPTFGVASRHPQFVKLMGRVQGEGMMLRLMGEHFQDVVDRFVAAFRRAVPELSAADLNWRIHFAIGAMAHALRSSPVLPTPPLAAGEVSERLVEFLAAGFRARVPAHEEK
jgi:hypothetical protein